MPRTTVSRSAVEATWRRRMLSSSAVLVDPASPAGAIHLGCPRHAERRAAAVNKRDPLCPFGTLQVHAYADPRSTGGRKRVPSSVSPPREAAAAYTARVTDLVTPRGTFPHLRVVGNLVFVSGTSARNPDNSIAGAAVDEMGTVTLDIRAQTRAVITNLERILATVGAGLADVVDVSTFLTTMNDFGGYNEVWSEFFDHTGPARTTVAVHQLPHPHLLIEMKAIARLPDSNA